jgi:phosphopantothenoylcysteine decarboxylase/phosphopantothenate--cysteine ligase
VDAAVMVAAVSDWRPESAAPGKLKKDAGAPEIRLVPNPDIVQTLSQPGPERPRLVVGFAAETEQLESHARDKLARKGCDWIVANDVTRPGVLGGEENAVTLITRDGAEPWPRATKAEVAARLAARVAEALGA